MADQAPASAPGWYPTPGGQRYWDGNQWTDHVAPSGPGRAPAAKRSNAKWVLLPILACFGLAGALIVVGALAGSGDDDKDQAGGDGTEQEQGGGGTSGGSQWGNQEVFAVGDTALSGDLEITVETVEDPWEPDDGLSPNGKRFIGVELNLTNVGDETVPFFAPLLMAMYDSEGRVWDPDTPTGGEPVDEIDIPAGASHRGWTYFAVDEDASGFEMLVKGRIDPNDDNGAVFLLD